MTFSGCLLRCTSMAFRISQRCRLNWRLVVKWTSYLTHPCLFTLYSHHEINRVIVKMRIWERHLLSFQWRKILCLQFTVTAHGQDLVSGTSFNKFTNNGAQWVGRDFSKGFGRLGVFPLPEDGSRIGSRKVVVLHWNLVDWESPKKEDYFSKLPRMCCAGTNWHKISLALPPPGALRTPTKRVYKERTASKRNKGALLPTPSGRVRCVLDHTDNYCCALRAAVLMKHSDVRVGHTEWTGSCHQPT
jgi:hypothetical protein